MNPEQARAIIEALMGIHAELRALRAIAEAKDKRVRDKLDAEELHHNRWKGGQRL